MSQFNIDNSKIEQVNDSGNNYKFAGKSEANIVSEGGNVAHLAGSNNTAKVDSPKKSFVSELIEKAKAFWKSIFG